VLPEAVVVGTAEEMPGLKDVLVEVVGLPMCALEAMA
jgi:hypothetical protein